MGWFVMATPVQGQLILFPLTLFNISYLSNTKGIKDIWIKQTSWIHPEGKRSVQNDKRFIRWTQVLALGEHERRNLFFNLLG